MKKKNINLFVLGAVVLTLALFGCNNGQTANTTAAGALIDGAALYNNDCSGCHGSLAKSGKRGASVSQIQDAISHNWGGMGAFASLTSDQLQSIATALSAPVTATPDTTTATDTPISATDSLDGAALYTKNCQNCHNPLATSTKAGRTAAEIQAAISGNDGGMKQYSNLTTAQLQAIADALATVPAPAPVQTPSPSSTSGSPDGAALYTAYCDSCHGALATSSKRGATVARIQTAVTGVRSMGQLSNLTSAQIQAIAAALGSTPSPAPSPTPTPTTTDGASLYTTYCSSCHGLLASSGHRGATVSDIQTGISNVSGMRSLSSLTTAQIQAIATALGSTPAPTPTPTPTSTDGASLYASYCSSCHGALASSSKRGATASDIQTGISSVSGMRSLSSLTTAQIQAIASVLATTPAPAPTPAPADGAGLYTTYCNSCHGSLAASSKAGRTAAQIQTAIGSVSGMRSLSNLTATQIQAIATALATAPTPVPTDGAALYTSYCSSCHGALSSSQVRGSSASTISSYLSSVSQMRSISLTSTQIQAIATALGTTPAPTPTPIPTDGASLYATYCSSCHGALATSSKGGATASQIQTGISSVSSMRSLSNLTTAQVQAIATALGTTAPTPTACGSCHAIPPGTGHHSTHRSRACSVCHGSGYSSTTVNSATHNNGVKNIASGSTPGWNPTTRSCSNSCHGTERW